MNVTNATDTGGPWQRNMLVAEIPSTMYFNTDELISVVSYSVLFLIASVANITMLFTIFPLRRKSRVNWFIMHMSIADLIVTLVMMPMEIGWHITVSWNAGDVACRIFMFFRVFGFYLSSSILSTMCIDR